MAGALEFILNGRPVRVEHGSPNTTLLEYLRTSGLTGAKEGCAEGDCGACSVAIVEPDADGRPAYRAINSCLVPICLMAGREIVSVEGISLGAPKQSERGCSVDLHPVQRKLVEHFGSQCGYCTPGFVCSMFEGYYRDDIRTEDDLDDQLSGNLCRCTGYRPIRDAAIEAFSLRRRRGNESQTKKELETPHVVSYSEDVFAERLKKSGARLRRAQYESGGERFFRPTSLMELLQLVQEVPDARIIAGATELGLDITKRYKKFPVLISVEAVPELNEIKAADTEWDIGAAVTLTKIAEKMAGEFPALGAMLRVFGS